MHTGGSCLRITWVSITPPIHQASTNVNTAAVVTISVADLQVLYNRVSQSPKIQDYISLDEILCMCHRA